MTSSHQGQKIAEAFWRRLWLKEVHQSSGLFVFIRVHSWFVFNNDQPFVLAGSAHQGGGPARRQTGVSQRGQAGFQRSGPPDTPHLTIGTPHPGARASRPHAVPSVAAQFPCDVRSRPPCRREPHGPGRSRGRAPLPVDSGGGDGRGCARLGAGGTPALPGGLHPMTSSHQGQKIAEAFWRRLWLKEVHLSSGLFVFIRVHSWFVFIDDRLFFLE